MINVTPGLEEIKQRFDRAAQGKEDAKHLFELLSSMKLNPNQRLYAWWGATETLLAKEAMFPGTKLNLLDKGMEKINATLKKFPADPEIILLRFMIESQVPAFLGRSKNLDNDKTFLLKNLQQKQQARDCAFVLETAPKLKYAGTLNKKEEALLETYVLNCIKK
ncbi:MAG: hypothetical protein RLZZ46_531 [Bacteroidota bacterium]|jgi:hypothetical protein